MLTLYCRDGNFLLFCLGRNGSSDCHRVCRRASVCVLAHICICVCVLCAVCTEYVRTIVQSYTRKRNVFFLCVNVLWMRARVPGSVNSLLLGVCRVSQIDAVPNKLKKKTKNLVFVLNRKFDFIDWAVECFGVVMMVRLWLYSQGVSGAC